VDPRWTLVPEHKARKRGQQNAYNQRDSSAWIRTTDLTIMSRARGCERGDGRRLKHTKMLEIGGYRERAACARLTGVVLWRGRLVDADAAQLDRRGPGRDPRFNACRRSLRRQECPAAA
jgi:hypothetical protein